MHLTLEADYAVRIMQVLCSAKNARTDAGEISRRACVTQSFTLKILRKLVSAGLVKSFKGTHGGYIAAKEPGDMTLLEVIEAIEGTYRFSKCLQDDSICNMGTAEGCCYRKVFESITDSVREQLAGITFSKLSGESE